MHSSFAAFFLLVAFALSAFLTVVEARPRHLDIETRADGEGEMQDALKYLEELDKYYSQVARPRENVKEDTDQNRITVMQILRDNLVQLRNPHRRQSMENGEEEPTVKLAWLGSNFGKRSIKRNEEDEKDLDGSKGNRPDSRFLQIQGLDNHLAHMSRPRFGKRGQAFSSRNIPAEILIPAYAR